MYRLDNMLEPCQSCITCSKALPHTGNTELTLIAYRALHAPNNDCITGRAPHTPERDHPPPCVVVMLHGSQLTQILSGIPDPQSVIPAG